MFRAIGLTLALSSVLAFGFLEDLVPNGDQVPGLGGEVVNGSLVLDVFGMFNCLMFSECVFQGRCGRIMVRVGIL